MELPEFFRDYFLVSETLRGGDSPSCPLCLTGAGDKVLFREEVSGVLLSPSPAPQAPSAPQGQLLLGSGSSAPSWPLCSWPSSFGASHCVLRMKLRAPAPAQSPAPARPSQPGAPTQSLVLQEGDHRWINPVARALQLLNSLYGPFGRTHGIGRCAKVWLPPLRPHQSHGSVSPQRWHCAVPPPGQVFGGPVCQGGQQRGGCCSWGVLEPPVPWRGEDLVPGLGCQPRCVPGPLVGAWGCSPGLAPSAPPR